jgi:hypothetical protein
VVEHQTDTLSNFSKLGSVVLSDEVVDEAINGSLNMGACLDAKSNTITLILQ